MTNEKLTCVLENVKRNWERPNTTENIGKSEKIISVGTGAFIFLKGIGNLISHPAIAVAEVVIGGGLLYRGLTGYCPVKELTDTDTVGSFYVKERFISDASSF